IDSDQRAVPMLRPPPKILTIIKGTASNLKKCRNPAAITWWSSRLLHSIRTKKVKYIGNWY
ncbi:MAG: hypothetical protein RKO24_14925, partial [Candidatus Competibacter sp.]|nr:hypothetical protein [Candidatus Competibacter sp.]